MRIFSHHGENTLRKTLADNLYREEFSLLHLFIGIYHRKLLYLLHNSGYFIPKRI